MAADTDLRTAVRELLDSLVGANIDYPHAFDINEHADRVRAVLDDLIVEETKEKQ